MCHFTGQVKWHKERRIKPTFGVISTKIDLPKFEYAFAGKQFLVDRPFVWLSMKTGYQDQDAVRRILESCEKQRYAYIAGANISDFLQDQKDESGKVIPNAPKQRRFTIEINARDVTFSDKPYPTVNTCIVNGKVEEVNGNWLLVKTWYKVKTETKYRHMEVISDSPTVTPALKGSNVSVIGKVCNKDPNGNERVYIAAETLLPL